MSNVTHCIIIQLFNKLLVRTQDFVKTRNVSRIIISTVYVALTASGCLSGNPSGTLVTVSPTPTPTATSTPLPVVVGPRAVKILFNLSQSGSFDSANGTASGTPPGVGNGLQVTRVFNPDNTLLATNINSTKSANWPLWLNSFEIGVSGSSNTSAPGRDCARFASNSEIFQQNCNLGGATLANCGAPPFQYRVSEVDCSSAATGNGGPSDGVYLRAIFNRSTNYIGVTDNILVVLEYAASYINPAHANPADCYNNSSASFSPELCSDFTWKAFVKKGSGDVVQPFFLLIPPAYSSVLVGQQPKQSGTTQMARQFVVPLSAFASDSNGYTTLQISRINSNFGSTNPTTYCTDSGQLPGNSPLCAGVVLYSITLYRI